MKISIKILKHVKEFCESDLSTFVVRPVSMLQTQIPDIIKAIHKQLREKSVKTRQGCFSLLTELVLVLPGALAKHFDQLVPGIIYSLGYGENY